MAALPVQRTVKTGVISIHNFLISFQVKIKVMFKPAAEAPAVTGSPHLQTSKLILLKCPLQKSPDLYAGVKGMW